MTDTQPAPLTDEEIAELREVLQGITPLPWTTDKYNLYLRAGKKRMVADDGDGEPECVARMRGAGGGEPQEQNLLAIAAVMNAAPRLLSQVEQLTAKLSDTDTFCGEYHGVCCGDCGAIMTIMRPGKYQCNACDYWSVTIHDALGTQSYDEGYDPIETLKQRVKQLTKERDEARRQAETNRRTMVELAKGDPEAAEVVLCRIADKLDEWPEKVEMAVEALIDLRADDANKIEQLAAQIERLTQQRDEMAATIDRTEKEKA